MRKRVFRHMWSAKAQNSAPDQSLRGPLKESLDTIECIKIKCPDETLRICRTNLNLCILRMLEDIFAWRGQYSGQNCLSNNCDNVQGPAANSAENGFNAAVGK